MHLVDALTRMHLVTLGMGSRSVPFTYKARQRFTVLKTTDGTALAARRRIASELLRKPNVIATLLSKPDNKKPDLDLMQQLSDAGIGKCPSSGMPVLNPSVCSTELRAALWRHYCALAATVNSRELGET